MSTNSSSSNNAQTVTSIQTIKSCLTGRWRDQADLFTDKNIISALLKVIEPHKLDSDGNYRASERYMQVSSYDPVLRVPIKPDLFLIYDEIVRAVAAAAAANTDAS
jgi:hypothetical protein